MKTSKILTAMAFAFSLPLASTAFAAEQTYNPGATSGSDAAGSQKKISSDFDKHDKDGDDKISQNEAAGGDLSNYFVAIDKNADGNINKDEFDSFVERYPSLVGDSDTEEAE